MTTIKSRSPDLIEEGTLKKIALALHLEVNCKDLSVSKHDASCFDYGKEEWLVLTDHEADELTRESLESYIDDCIFPDIPEHSPARTYFDTEGFIGDCISYDGRGHSLAHYDGTEWEVYIEATKKFLFLYRRN